MEFLILKRINAGSPMDAIQREYEAELIEVRMVDSEDFISKKDSKKLGYGR